MFLLLAVIAIVILIAVAVLFVPVDVELTLLKHADSQNVGLTVRVRWLGLSVPVHRGSKAGSRPAPAAAARSRGRISALLFSPGFLPRSIRLVVEIASAARPRELDIYARLGFDDPSDTGMFLGCLSLGPITSGGYRIHVEPDFTDEVLAGRMRLRWTRSLAALLRPILTFMASPVVWRAIRNYRASRHPAIAG